MKRVLVSGTPYMYLFKKGQNCKSCIKIKSELYVLGGAGGGVMGWVLRPEKLSRYDRPVVFINFKGLWISNTSLWKVLWHGLFLSYIQGNFIFTFVLGISDKACKKN